MAVKWRLFSDRVDVRAVILAIGLHAGLALLMFFVPQRDSFANTLVELEILERENPEDFEEPEPLDPDLVEDPEPEPEAPEPEPEPEKPKPKPRAAPLAEPEPEPEETPPPEPEPTYFGMLPDSTDGTGTVIVPIGDRLDVDPSITTDDPSKVGGKKFVERGPSAGTGTEKAPPPKEEKPVSFAMVTKPPKLKTEIRAKYPEEAKELGIEGIVLARLTIGADGRVKKVKILSSPGYGLDEEAKKALMKFEFEPAKLDGKPVSTVIPRYEYEFVLD